LNASFQFHVNVMRCEKMQAMWCVDWSGLVYLRPSENIGWRYHRIEYHLRLVYIVDTRKRDGWACDFAQRIFSRSS